MTAAEPAPREIRLRRAENRLDIAFADGSTAQLAAEYLRVESPSAEVQGHAAAEKRLVAGKKNVGITAIEPIGNYAIRPTFSDGHDTGIFTWAYLRQLNREQAARWSAYLAALAAAGQDRD